MARSVPGLKAQESVDRGRGDRAPSDDLDRLDVDEIRRFLGRRWPLIVAVAFGCAVLALVVCLTLKPVYSATSQVLLDPHRAHVFGQDTVQPDAALDSSIVDSQISIITSTRLLAKVINKERLTEDPEFAASAKPGLLARLMRLFRPAKASSDVEPALDGIDPKLAPVIVHLFNKIEVVRIAKSYVLSVSVSANDPAKATRLANSLAQSFVDDRVDVHAKSVQQAATFFEDRLGNLRDQVRQSERAVADYRKQHDLLTTTMDGQITVSEQQLQDLNQQLALAATDTAEKLARYQQATRFRSAGSQIDTLPDIVRSPVVVALRGQQADLMRRASDLSAVYGPAYPAIAQIRAQRTGLDRAISAEMGRLITTSHNDYDVAAAREAALRKTIAGLTDVSGGNNEVGVKLRELERTNMANKALFENFLNRAKLTQEQSSFEEPDARLISPALEPTAPASPKTKLIVPVAGVAGLILGLGLAAAADRFRRGGGVAVPPMADAFILGQLPEIGRADADDLVEALARDPGSGFARAIAALAVRLAPPEGGKRTIALMPLGLAAGSGPDRTSILAGTSAEVALALGCALGDRSRRVLLVDADATTRILSAACDARGAVGLAEVVAGHVSAEDALVAWPGFAVLPAGGMAPFPQAKRLGAFLAQARVRYDIVLVCAPALTAGGAEVAECEGVDGLALVASQDDLGRGEFIDAVDAASATEKFLGLVLTRTTSAADEAFALAG